MSSPTIPASAPLRRLWSQDEELANSVSHGAGFLAMGALAPWLVAHAAQSGSTRAMVGAALFALTALFLYFSSAMHHGSRTPQAKERFERMDHAGIALLIAGTYSPFALGPLWGDGGLVMMAVIWPLALAGALVNFVRGVPPILFTTALYVGMGWFMLAFLRPLARHLPLAGLCLVLGGGLVYTSGLAFYFARRLRFHHLAWHLCVMLGTALHAVAIWRFAA